MGSQPKEMYILGRDAKESKRLDAQHAFVKAVFGDTLIDQSISSRNALSIADVGTGTGVWLQDVSETLRSKHPAQGRRLFHGFDISDAQFPAVQDDEFKFTVHDVLQPFPPSEHGRYDLVHVRLLMSALKEEDYSRVASNLLSLLKPGGHIQWVEVDNSNFRATPPSDPELAKEIHRIICEALVPSGISLHTPKSMHSGMTTAGFQSVRTAYHKPSPDMLGKVVQWCERMLHAMLPPSLLKLGEVDSMESAKRRTQKLVDRYLTECPDWGREMCVYVCVIGQKPY